MKTKKLKPIPAGDNPFLHDIYNMGTQLGSNVMVMHSNHTNQVAPYLIIVDMKTGKRLRIDF